MLTGQGGVKRQVTTRRTKRSERFRVQLLYSEVKRANEGQVCRWLAGRGPFSKSDWLTDEDEQGPGPITDLFERVVESARARNGMNRNGTAPYLLNMQKLYVTLTTQRHTADYYGGFRTSYFFSYFTFFTPNGP